MEEERKKIVFVGDSGVGKTSIINRFDNNDFLDGQPTTIGTNFITKPYYNDKVNLSLYIYDTAGQERFDSLSKLYYRDADVMVIVYSVNTPVSYNKIPKYLKFISETLPVTTPIIIVGNKSDLEKKVNSDDAQALADSEKVDFMECSAKTSEGIDELFNKIGEAASTVKQQGKEKPISLNEEEQKEQKENEKKKCC